MSVKSFEDVLKEGDTKRLSHQLSAISTYMNREQHITNEEYSYESESKLEYDDSKEEEELYNISIQQDMKSEQTFVPPLPTSEPIPYVPPPPTTTPPIECEAPNSEFNTTFYVDESKEEVETKYIHQEEYDPFNPNMKGNVDMDQSNTYNHVRPRSPPGPPPIPLDNYTDNMEPYTTFSDVPKALDTTEYRPSSPTYPPPSTIPIDVPSDEYRPSSPTYPPPITSSSEPKDMYTSNYGTYGSYEYQNTDFVDVPRIEEDSEWTQLNVASPYLKCQMLFSRSELDHRFKEWFNISNRKKNMFWSDPSNYGNLDLACTHPIFDFHHFFILSKGLIHMGYSAQFHDGQPFVSARAFDGNMIQIHISEIEEMNRYDKVLKWNDIMQWQTHAVQPDMLEKESELIHHIGTLYPHIPTHQLKPIVNGERWGQNKKHSTILILKKDDRYVLFGHRLSANRKTTSRFEERDDEYVKNCKRTRDTGSLELPIGYVDRKDVHPYETAYRTCSRILSGTDNGMPYADFEKSIKQVLMVRKDGAVIIELNGNTLLFEGCNAKHWIRDSTEKVFPKGIVWAHYSEINNIDRDPGMAHVANIPFAVPDCKHAYRSFSKYDMKRNEHVLYHGTSETSAKLIWKDGFKIPVKCDRSWGCDVEKGICRCTMLGFGIYGCHWANARNFAQTLVHGTRPESRADGTNTRRMVGVKDRGVIIRMLVHCTRFKRLTQEDTCVCCGKSGVDHLGIHLKEDGIDMVHSPKLKKRDGSLTMEEWVIKNPSQVERLTIHWT